MPGTHSLLSPSGAHRWMNCTPSARQTEGMDEESSWYAQEGTEAHELCAYLVDMELGRDTDDPRPSMQFYNTEMQECAEDYRDYILSLIHEGDVHFVDTEVSLDMSRWIPEGRGTSDCVLVVGTTLHIVDYKHGKGVPVEVEDNPQLMIYGLGALNLLDVIYDIEEVRLSIVQPRISNTGSWTISKTDLLDWGDNVLRPLAELAWKGCGEMRSGDWCRWCLLKASCRQRAEDNLELARMDFRKPPVLSDEELGQVLSRAGDLESWVGDLRAYALSRLMGGGTIPGWKAVEGRSVRTWSDAAKVADTVREAGYDPYRHEVLGITAMTEMLGKERFNELLGSLVIKPRGKATLAPADDRRPAINSAVCDFRD